jgi:Predicted membrane protein
LTFNEILGTLVWTAAGAVLLFILMAIDSFFTKYRDLEEMKNGNTAVTVRFVLKLASQGYILSRSIVTSDDLWEALLVSFVSFVILFVLEWIVEAVLKALADLRLDEGVKKGIVGYGLIAGSLHGVGALIIGACL